MPHTGFLCPDPGQWQTDELGNLLKIVPVDACLECSLTRVYRECPYDFADLFMRKEDTYDELFSPSRFNGCDRELVLKSRYDFWVDPQEQAYRVRGTATHAKLEVTDPRVVGEARVYRVLDGAVDHLGRPALISVKPDKVYPTLREIHDDKTWKYLPRAGGKPVEQAVKTENLLQLTVGAWAWAQPAKVVYNDERGEVLAPDPIAIDHGQIIIRDGASQLRQGPLELIPFPVLERWMRLRILQLNARRTSDELPPYVAKDKRWRCRTCPVRYLCGIPKELYIKPKETKHADSDSSDSPSDGGPDRKPVRPTGTRTRRSTKGA